MGDWAWTTILPILLAEAFVAAALLAPATLRPARRWGFVARPGERHAHDSPTPALGGVAIVGGVFLVVFGNLALAHGFHHWAPDLVPPQVARYLANIPSKLPQLAAVLGGALGAWALGLVDDRRPLGPWLKLALMSLLALLLPLAGVRVEGFLPWPWAGAALTVLWVVFLMNSFNFLDNMDGLCAGVAAIGAAAFALLSYFSGQWFMAALYAVLVGALLGFLRHNFHPARLFMGDNGSLFIGYLIGALSVLSTYYERGVVPTAWPILTPAIILGVPIFDTFSVLWIRMRSGQPLMVGDRNHFSHRLVDLGMSKRGAVIFIYIVTAAIALGAIPLRSVGPAGAVAILAQTALLFWIIHRIERTRRGGE